MRLHNTTPSLPLLLSLLLSLAFITNAYYPDPGLNHRRSYRRSIDDEILSDTFSARSADALEFPRFGPAPNGPRFARRSPSSIHLRRRATPDVNQGIPKGADTKGLPDGTWKAADGTYQQTQALKDFFKEANKKGDENVKKYMQQQANKPPEVLKQERQKLQEQNRQMGIPSVPGGAGGCGPYGTACG